MLAMCVHAHSVATWCTPVTQVLTACSAILQTDKKCPQAQTDMVLTLRSQK